MRLRTAIFAGASLPAFALLGGCAPSVTLAVPPEVLSSEWRSAGPAAVSAGAPVTDLGAALGSARLQSLLERAAARNADIGVAAARVEQARAQLILARAAMLPVVSGSAGVNSGRRDGSGRGLFDFAGGFGGLDISYELDLFGRGRAERRAARARFAAAQFDREAAALVVESETARAFVQHATLAERIRLLDRNLVQARELERIIGVRLRAGEATRVDLGLQTIQVRQLETDRDRLVEAHGRTLNALAVLAGEEAPRFSLESASLSDFAVPAIAPVQPGELLVRRPDIRAAEARIAAAEGDIGQARAAFLPRLRLSASSLGSAALGGPLGATFSLASDLLAPIFNRGRLRGELAVASAVQLESVELYRGALLAALAEGENGLAAVGHSRNREQLLADIVAQAQITARLARRQYIEGEADLRTVLDAEQLLVQAEDARAVAFQERLEAAIDLYKAMGGRPRS